MLDELFERATKANPDKPVLIMVGQNRQLTLKELNDSSNRAAQYFRSIGLTRGDHIAIIIENNISCVGICRGALRAGLYVTAINFHLTPKEAAYIANDCGAVVIISSIVLKEIAEALVPLTPNIQHRLMVEGSSKNYLSYEQCISRFPADPIADPSDGDLMLYSSGTTGQPKGVKRTLSDPNSDQPANVMLTNKANGYSDTTKFLLPAPIYHSGSMNPAVSITGVGGAVVIMPKFDAEQTLKLIEEWGITHIACVPTMFVRMLKLPEDVRNRYGRPQLRKVIHTAAPCPEEVKRKMIGWWGPILFELFGGTETNGMTAITSDDWLEHPGSVGRPVLGKVHICNDEGAELPIGEVGTIYFERDILPFQYHNDVQKTRESQHPEHPFWTTIGDIGYVSEEGYLYLTDRKSFMIISGGVNIYPQAVENCLALHPAILDVAVIGVPDNEMGEAVKAVVETPDNIEPSDELAAEIIQYTRDNLAHYTCPRSVDFVDKLPRLPTGKLYKKALKDKYWEKNQ